ncbi:MAG TPA: glycosyltransferase family 4 protein [Acidimicrobiales bacterium]|nr:glycosyltransferase family 4 protein [Acidimicrobiales bacterium]
MVASSSRPLLVIANWRDGRHPDAGGAEVVCERLAKKFVERGFDVVLLTSAVTGASRKELIDGYRTIRRGNRFTVYPWALLWMALHRSQIHGVIDSQNGIPFFSPLALPPKTPALMLLHHIHQDQFGIYFSPFMARVGRFLEHHGSRLVYRKRSIVAISPSTRAGARRRLGLKGDIVVIPPGSDSVVAPLPSRRARPGDPRIVCVGRLVVHKCTSSIVEAVPSLLREFPRLELHLVGDGPERPPLQALVESLGLGKHVVVHGAVSAPERDRLMRTAWISVNASVGEGWGLSVVEANALGIPVLAYRRPGLRDSIRHGETGWLIDEEQPLGPAIAEALRQVSSDAGAETMATRAREWAARFTWDEMANQVLALLRAEEGRLAQSAHDRRTNTDLATVARIPVDLLQDGVVPRFRGNDKSLMSDGDLTVLLRSADTETARIALRRAGLSDSVIADERVAISVAQQVDLVSPTTSSSAEVATSALERQDPLAG